MYLAGLDIGTTGCKCSVYSDLGDFVDESYKEYEISITEQSHTIDPTMVWNSVKTVVKEIAKNNKNLQSICVTSFGEASVILDENLNVLSNAYLFTDPNGEKECNEITNEVGRDYILKTTGLAPGKMFSCVKWKFQKDNNPELWKKGKYICLFEDYIVYLLSGVRQIDYSLATRTMAFDVHNYCWNKKILKVVGVDENMLSKVVPTGQSAGLMLEDLQNELGLESRPMIVTGCHDQIAAAIGSGVLNQNQAVDGTGTVECLTCVFSNETKVDEKSLNNGGYAIVPYSDDLYVTYAFSYTGGALLKWYRNKIADSEADMLKKVGQNPFKIFDDNINDTEPSELLILPHFAGSGTPYMNNDAKGAIIGLTLETTKEEIYQALMEGVTYEMKLNIELLEKAGIVIDELYATGGGATSKKWLQMKADILGKKVISLGASQSGTVACIMLGGVACGVYKSLKEASQLFVKHQAVYQPRKEIQQKYEKQYQEYKQLYPKLYRK